jgi:hypothetical protein
MHRVNQGGRRMTVKELISSLIKDNNKRISMYKKENAYLEKLKSKLEETDE